MSKYPPSPQKFYGSGPILSPVTTAFFRHVGILAKARFFAKRLKPEERMYLEDIGHPRFKREGWRQELDAVGKMDSAQACAALCAGELKHSSSMGEAISRLGSLDEIDAVLASGILLSPRERNTLNMHRQSIQFTLKKQG